MVEVNEGRHGVTSWVITPLIYFTLINGYNNDTTNFIFRNFVPRISGCYVCDL